MATHIQTSAAATAWKPYRLSVKQFLAMTDAGVFPHDARLELLGGILVDKMTKHHPHNFAMLGLNELMRPIVPAPWLVSVELSIRMGRFWLPEPDFAIIQGPYQRYRHQGITTADIAILIEVADSSYAIDRGLKFRRYASARVAVYWIVNIARIQVEVYRDPSGKGRAATYGLCEVFGIDAVVPVVIDGIEVGRVAVRDIML